MSTLFRPTPRELGALVALALLALGAAFYLRFQVVEQSAVGIACAKTPSTVLCSIRAATVTMLINTVFGTIAIVAALTNLLRPSALWLVPAVTAAGFGLVLYNTRISALAVALMLLSLARPSRAAA